ncbi:AraC family transcriptional regulator [Dyella sp. EPa41]|uniref:AraC family transcriptional regulator n=1 Tax=Dyella sp. EPa41 TaxID=1561194 RepID=UPI001915DBAB|nr:AraC family transcriptional regulator [Dyella sp. EPa41]
MDTLSELLDAYPARGNLDVHCQWSGHWAYPHRAEAPGSVRFHVILQGQVHLKMDDAPVLALSAGDIAVLPAGSRHLLSSRGDDGRAPAPRATIQPHGLLEWRTDGSSSPEVDMLCGRIDFGAGATTLLSALPRQMHLPGEAGVPMAALAPLVALMRSEVQGGAPGARSVVGQLSSMLFVLAVRHWWQQAGAPDGVLGLLREPRLRPAAIAMLSHQHEPLTIDELAAGCHMSRASFLRLFERTSGTPPAQLLAKLRMDTAAVRLERGGESVGAIGEAVGFQSESAFIRAFERHKGMSPAAYRRLMKRDASVS